MSVRTSGSRISILLHSILFAFHSELSLTDQTGLGFSIKSNGIFDIDARGFHAIGIVKVNTYLMDYSPGRVCDVRHDILDI